MHMVSRPGDLGALESILRKGISAFASRLSPLLLGMAVKHGWKGRFSVVYAEEV